MATIGHPEALREVPGDYADEYNNVMAMILLLKGWRTTLLTIDDFIEQLETEDDPVAAHLREQRTRALRLFKNKPPDEAFEDSAFFWVLESIRLSMTAIKRDVFLLPLAKTGDKVRKPFADANDERSAAAKRRYALWQTKATEKWAEPQHAHKRKRAIAQLVAKETGDDIDMIRKHIQKVGIAGRGDNNP